MRGLFADEIKTIMNTPRGFIFGTPTEKGRTIEKATILNDKRKIPSIINDEPEPISVDDGKYYKIKSFLSESNFINFDFHEIVDTEIQIYYLRMLNHLKNYAGGWVSYVDYIGQPAEHPYIGWSISNRNLKGW